MLRPLIFMCVSIAALSLLTMQNQTFAALYKCPTPEGVYTYTDQPCANGFVKKGGEWVELKKERRRQKEAQLAKELAAEIEREREIRRQQEILDKKRERRRLFFTNAKKNGKLVVEYIVEGSVTDSASLTYFNESGDLEQREVYLPWRKLMAIDGNARQPISISAQNDEEYGGVTVKIAVNNRVLKQSEAYGGYKIASVKLN